MPEAMESFMVIVRDVAPYSIFWALGMRAFRFVIGVITGKDVEI